MKFAEKRTIAHAPQPIDARRSFWGLAGIAARQGVLWQRGPFDRVRSTQRDAQTRFATSRQRRFDNLSCAGRSNTRNTICVASVLVEVQWMQVQIPSKDPGQPPPVPGETFKFLTPTGQVTEAVERCRQRMVRARCHRELR